MTSEQRLISFATSASSSKGEPHETLERLRKRGAQLVGEVVEYNDAFRLCYMRGPEGLLIGLAQELS